jgi:hypothetical protein
MPSATIKLTIGAPRALVWDVLMDFDNWRYWMPNVVRASVVGEPKVNRKLQLTLKGVNPTVHEYILYATIVKLKKESSFALQSDGMFPTVAIFTLESLNDNTTLVTSTTKEYFDCVFTCCPQWLFRCIFAETYSIIRDDIHALGGRVTLIQRRTGLVAPMAQIAQLDPDSKHDIIV